MKIELHRYRVVTPIKNISEAKRISKGLCGGDFGLIIFTCTQKERRVIHVYNQGEYRFIVK